MAAFKQLRSLLKSEDGINNKAISNDNNYKVTTKDELVSLLGEPDRKVGPSVWEYDLNASANNKLVLGVSASGKLRFYSLKN